MALIEWSESLAVGQELMDATHREFVELLNQVAEAADADLLARLDAFVGHTETHFRQEEAWMEALSFPPLACHQGDHQNILELVREVRRRVAGGEMHFARRLAAALAEWFPLHAGGMDTMLAQFIVAAGYVPEADAHVPGQADRAAVASEAGAGGSSCKMASRTGGCS